jgi:uncharacterized membrane protein
MSTDELSQTTAETNDPREAARTPLLQRPWVVPLALLTVIFIAYAVPPYLSLDPARARIQPMPPHVSYYPLLVSHIFLGSVALLAACLQVWPWLRQSHPAIHRWSGRIYVAAALTGSVCVMIISPMGLYGANQRVANTMLALLWLGTTMAGFERSGNAVTPITGNGCCAALHWPSRSSPTELGRPSLWQSLCRRFIQVQRSIRLR